MVRRPALPASAPPPGRRSGGPLYELIELLFFAYRDFVGGPDEILAEYGFGRAHHRVLHFVSRNPGMRVTDLLDILKITKQSLGRVLKQLVDTGHIEQRPGPHDRRQRLLYPTERGRQLALRLAELQSARIEAALAELGPAAAEDARRFLALLINEDERAAVLRLAAWREGDR
jgi:DNA-binding MarR family transcriptional regulator